MKNLKNILLGCVAVTGLYSCEKDLDQQPTDVFSDANAFLSISDVQQGTNAAFGRYGGYANDMYASALLSDEAKLGGNNDGQGALTYRYEFSSDNTTGADVIAAWGSYYSLIDQCNRVLPKVATVPATPSEEPRRNILRAHLIGLRALGHFGLLQSYTKVYDPNDQLGVPLMLSSNATGLPARNTVGEVMNQIITDLAEAKSLLPDVTPADFTDTVLNKVNIAAYQARIALYRRDYDQAIAFASEVINSNVKPLASGPAFASIWTDQSANEVLFKIRYETSTAIGSLWTTLNGNVYIAPSDKLRASYSGTDVRATAYVGQDANNNYYVKKFFESARGGRIVHLKAARTAEMYLIRAEANARKATPDIAAAAADLNFLRSNRIGGYVDQSFSNINVLINEIMEERFKELAFEGFRYFDLKRNGLPVQRLLSDANAQWAELPANSFRFVLPIPRSEINANPNMIQNDGYN
ncbi:MAG TPA: RagB/SusD family nutrient uptake outer membrane protein [Ferruginibacter sp.]|nr:RagB/SusD family nutrient uptake outer membrane protein [Ferruginibacter sp.]HRO06966.1 RagB/SusD family nutrient uptake outer membrane protein [Ferruginibacter sp.]HRO95428.1 RagB/SusD family nutrient uptake outer membrane protein [Ferruginibacter sp.]HRP50496.1 RagB/SusD family nutrient uptake outer membrane protein [Ferruginibacter sp.]